MRTTHPPASMFLARGVLALTDILRVQPISVRVVGASTRAMEAGAIARAGCVGGTCVMNGLAYVASVSSQRAESLQKDLAASAFDHAHSLLLVDFRRERRQFEHLAHSLVTARHPQCSVYQISKLLVGRDLRLSLLRLKLRLRLHRLQSAILSRGVCVCKRRVAFHQERIQ